MKGVSIIILVMALALPIFFAPETRAGDLTPATPPPDASPYAKNTGDCTFTEKKGGVPPFTTIGVEVGDDSSGTVTVGDPASEAERSYTVAVNRESWEDGGPTGVVMDTVYVTLLAGTMYIDGKKAGHDSTIVYVTNPEGSSKVGITGTVVGGDGHEIKATCPYK